MRILKKIQKWIQNKEKRAALREVIAFKVERLSPIFCLKGGTERVAHKENLTTNYTYQSGDDLLAKKQDFINQYTINEKEQIDYFVHNPFDKPSEIRTRAWLYNEQVERFEAHKAWRKVVRRNYKEQMRKKFMSQRTR